MPEKLALSTATDEFAAELPPVPQITARPLTAEETSESWPLRRSQRATTLWLVVTSTPHWSEGHWHVGGRGVAVAREEREARIRDENHSNGLQAQTSAQMAPKAVLHALQRHRSDASGIAPVDGALHRRRVRSHRLRAAAHVSEPARGERTLEQFCLVDRALGLRLVNAETE